jgi:hypothetical protein
MDWRNFVDVSVTGKRRGDVKRMRRLE